MPDEMKWSVMGVWNEMLGLTKRRDPKVRDYISPSDIGKNYWDRYQKMMGVPETNPFDDRVLRIFSAGDEFHNLMKNVFKAAGIFIDSQDDSGWSVIEPTDKTLKLLGKYDVRAGGKPDYLMAKQACKVMGLSEFVTARTLTMVERLLETYPNGLQELIYEFKSINSMAFWNKKDYLQDAYPHHRLQLYSELVANKMEEGRLLYISKDDLVTAEFPIYLNDGKLKNELQQDLEKMTHYIKTKTEPPKPNYVIFDKRAKLRFQKNKEKHVIVGSYVANWEVERSSWFTLMTGCKTVEQWQGKIKGEIADKNAEIKDSYIKAKGL